MKSNTLKSWLKPVHAEILNKEQKEILNFLRFTKKSVSILGEEEKLMLHPLKTYHLEKQHGRKLKNLQKNLKKDT